MSSRFAVAVHLLAAQALFAERWLTSGFLAKSVNTHPVVVRRILGRLRRAGLVRVRGGPRGGTRLARPPARIPLAEVYRAVEEPGLLALHPRPSRRCPVGRNIKAVLSGVVAEAERGLLSRLQRHTLADVVRRIESQGRRETALS